MLELLTHKNIAIGTRLEVQRRFAFDNSLEIKLEKSIGEEGHIRADQLAHKSVKKPVFDAAVVTVSEHLAKNVFVTYEE
jgi:DtxR family Mn-dependent transcriptional regulator